LRNRRYKNQTTSRAEKAVRVVAILFGAVAFLMVGAYGFVLWFIEAPTVDRAPIARDSVETAERPDLEREPDGDTTVELPALEGDSVWRRDVYTILIAGEDDGFGGPDVIMVVLFDAGNRTLDVLSIPRDTIVNVDWPLKKINSYQHLFRRSERYQHHPHYIYALRDGVANLVGYRTDFWITLRTDGFRDLVNAIGGVYFDVPQRMLYSDPYQDLFIDLQPGYQRLDGTAAEGLVRFRRYPTGDIRRVQVQHEFLRALSGQLLQARNILVIDELVRIFRDNVDTDLSIRNLIWFGMEFLQLESENIRFHSVDREIANIFDNVNGVSYVSLFVEPWVELINTYMNPFTTEIRAADLEILTRDPNTGAFFTTNGAPFVNNWAG